MSELRRALLSLLSVSLIATAAAAQQESPRPASAPVERAVVTVAAAGGRVRFAAPNRVARLRLEVLSAAGDVLSEVSYKGSVLDWAAQDAQGQPLADGSYLCVLTVKDVTGRITQRLTWLEVAGGGNAVSVRAASPAELTARQAEAVGPVEAEAAGVAGDNEAPAATLLAHDGADGQIVTTSGDLSFRGGDFFTGRDRELMRLGADGTLDLSGPLLARGGIRFSDGTVLESAGGAQTGKGAAKGGAKGAGKAGAGGDAPEAAGTGTVNRLAKWAETGGAGALTDSAVTESGGKVGIGIASPAQTLHVFGKGLFQNTATASLFIVDRTDGKIAALGAGGISATFAYDQTGIFKIESNARANIAAGVFGPEVGATTRLMIDIAGRVGVGTTSPTGKFHVVSGADMPAVYAVSANRAVWGSSTGASRGVFGDSQSGEGVHGESVTGTGVAGISAGACCSTAGVYGASTNAGGLGVRGDGATGVYGFSATNGGVGVLGEANTGTAYGVYGRSTSTSTTAAGVYGGSANGIGVRGDGAGSLGYGVYANNPAGMGLGVFGNATQNREGGGLVKAMIHVNADGTIARCYNSRLIGSVAFTGTPLASTAPCGFSVSRNDSFYYVDFGFKVDDRFFSLTVGETLGGGGAYGRVLLKDALNIPENQALVLLTDEAGFFLIVY